MTQKFKNWIKNLDGLVWMKLWVAVILIACFYWLFSDMELEFGSKIYLPLIYFYSTELYITKKVTVLIVPILMNIALWVPCYWSYIFIRLVLYAERIAALLWIAYFIVSGNMMAILIFYLIKKITVLVVPILMNIALWIPCYWSYILIRLVLYAERIAALLWITFFIVFCVKMTIFMAQGSTVYWIFVSGIFMAFNEVLYRNFITDKYKEKFLAVSKPEEKVTLLTRKLAVIFYLAIFLLLSGENLLQKKLPVDDLQVETRNSIKLVKENKVEEIPYSDGLQTKLSRDEKMLLVKIPSYKEEGNNKNMFVVDLASMETISILPSSNSTTKNFNDNDYDFTPDNKYVIVGNRVMDNPKIKFAVLDIATGKVDPRFHDPQGLLEDLPQDIEEVPLIRFNPSGDYFVVISRVKYPDYRLEFWDYKQGILVYVEEIKGKIKEATWSSERKILFLGDYNFYNETRIANNVTEFVEQREILNGGYVLSTRKEKITADIQEEDWSRKKHNFITSDDSGKYISILNTSFNDNNVEIWEIASEKKIFSLASDNKIKSIVFHPDGKQLIVFELLRDERIRITFWDIATKKQQQRFFIQSSLKGNTISLFDRSTALFFNNSNKVLLIGKSVDIISLKNL